MNGQGIGMSLFFPSAPTYALVRLSGDATKPVRCVTSRVLTSGNIFGTCNFQDFAMLLVSFFHFLSNEIVLI